MALTFDFTDMIASLGRDEYERITTHPDDAGLPWDAEGRRWHPVTDAVIVNMMIIHMNQITGTTVDEVWWRTAFRQALHSPLFHIKGVGSFYLTRKDIENHRGLRTNVTTKTRRAFISHMTDSRNAMWLTGNLNKDGASAFDIFATRNCAGRLKETA